MAFVLDNNDPNNQGMFSKAGRFTSEKYMIFQKKDEILNNQRKFLKVTSLPHLKMDLETKDPTKNFHEDDDDRPRVTPSSKTRPQIEPFSMQQSRTDFYEVKKNKHPPPPCGFYNPKFYHVDRKVQTLFRYDKEKTEKSASKKKILSATMSEFNFNEITKSVVVPERVKPKIVGPTPLHLQKGRDELKSAASVKSGGNDPHESRFTILHFPSNSGRVKRPMTVDMSKSMSRDTNSMYKSLEYSPDYAPNFEFGKKSLGSPGPSFDRMSSRKTLAQISYSINENPFDTSHIENLKYARPKTVKFETYSPREFDPSSPLPSFMQKSVNSRFALGSVRQKMLEINNFSDGKFQTLYSSFSPNKSQKSWNSPNKSQKSFFK